MWIKGKMRKERNTPKIHFWRGEENFCLTIEDAKIFGGDMERVEESKQRVSMEGEKRPRRVYTEKELQERTKNSIQKLIRNMTAKNLVTVQIPKFILVGLQKKRRSNLEVITLAKKLVSYIMRVTDNAPKKYRYTFVNRLQNYSISILDNLVKASMYRKDVKATLEKRKDCQREAYTDLRMLSYVAFIAYENRVLSFKQQTLIGSQADYIMERLYAWMTE